MLRDKLSMIEYYVGNSCMARVSYRRVGKGGYLPPKQHVSPPPPRNEAIIYVTLRITCNYHGTKKFIA